MAFYEDRVEHFGGALVLFKRNLSVAVPNAKAHRQPNWYMRLKIGGRKGYVTRSTKLTVYEDVYEQLAHCVGTKETAFLTAEQWRCGLCGQCWVILGKLALECFVDVYSACASTFCCCC